MVGRTLLEDSPDEPMVAVGEAEDIGSPRHVGRYTILERVGSGSMGMVFAAYDPDLDRKVAVKVLRRRRQSPRARARMIREAQALAKLSHPNVVAVHDAGVHEGQVFVAMEYVEGIPIQRWLQTLDPSSAGYLRKVLDVFVAAGRGLSAAHGAGLIHRDFKPDNVLVGNKGEVRVVDFGLAARSSNDSSSSVSNDLIAAEPHLTQAGSLLGTPAYMAPEQFESHAIGPATDQFSFCIALYEALYGHRPFEGYTTAAIAYSVLHGEIRTPPSGAKVPGWLRRVILRGLAREPNERWPSMDALLAQLARDPRRMRKRAIAVSAGVLVVGAGGVTAGHNWALGRSCDGAAESLSEVYDPARRARVDEALRSVPVHYSADTAELVLARLDGFEREWVAMHTDACLAHARGEQSESLLDARMGCLQRRRLELAAALDILGEPDPSVVRHAVSTMDGVGSVQTCGDIEGLSERVELPSDPAIAAQIRQIEADLVRVRTLGAAGRFDEALQQARLLAAQARALAYEPTLAETLFVQGRLEDDQGRYELAHRTLSDAYAKALSAGHDLAAARAAIELVRVAGYRRFRYDEAELRVTDAESLLRRLARRHGPEVPELEGDLLQARAMVAHREGEFPMAVTLLEQARDRFASVLGPEHRKVADTLNALGNVRVAERRFADALDHYGEALRLRERLLGPDHPDVGGLHNNIGLAYKNLQHWAEAEAHLRPALRIVEAQLAPDHPNVQMVVRNLANTYRMAGRHDEAAALYERWLRQDGEATDATVDVMMSRAESLAQLGRFDEAVEVSERAQATVSLLEDRALELRTHGRRGSLLLGANRLDAARRVFEDALQRVADGEGLGEAPDEDRGFESGLRFGWARAAIGSDRGKAIEAARTALALLQQSGAEDARLQPIREWLRAQGA